MSIDLNREYMPKICPILKGPCVKEECLSYMTNQTSYTTIIQVYDSIIKQEKFRTETRGFFRKRQVQIPDGCYTLYNVVATITYSHMYYVCGMLKVNLETKNKETLIVLNQPMKMSDHTWCSYSFHGTTIFQPIEKCSIKNQNKIRSLQ
jgi:hypothetical protein